MIKHTFLIFICSINTVTAAISIQKPEVADLAKVKELMAELFGLRPIPNFILQKSLSKLLRLNY